jgi:hypothetical protein
MGKKPMTVAEMARMGGRARAAKYTREQLRDFAKKRRQASEVGRQGAAAIGAITRGRQESGRVRRRIGRLGPYCRPSGRWNAGC